MAGTPVFTPIPAETIVGMDLPADAFAPVGDPIRLRARITLPKYPDSRVTSDFPAGTSNDGVLPKRAGGLGLIQAGKTPADAESPTLLFIGRTVFEVWLNRENGVDLSKSVMHGVREPFRISDPISFDRPVGSPQQSLLLSIRHQPNLHGDSFPLANRSSSVLRPNRLFRLSGRFSLSIPF